MRTIKIDKYKISQILSGQTAWYHGLTPSKYPNHKVLADSTLIKIYPMLSCTRSYKLTKWKCQGVPQNLDNSK